MEQVLREDAADAGSDPLEQHPAYAYDDTVFHGYLYAVPDGMGIEFDKNSYLWDAENPIYSRYVMCGHGTRVRNACWLKAGRSLSPPRIWSSISAVEHIWKDNEAMQKISYVIPCYRSEHTLPHVVTEIREKMQELTQYTYDIFLVNDASPDNTMETIRDLCEKYDNIKASASPGISDSMRH